MSSFLHHCQHFYRAIRNPNRAVHDCELISLGQVEFYSVLVLCYAASHQDNSNLVILGPLKLPIHHIRIQVFKKSKMPKCPFLTIATNLRPLPCSEVPSCLILASLTYQNTEVHIRPIYLTQYHHQY